MSRMAIFVPLEVQDAETVRERFARAISKLQENLRKTMTDDQEKEMAEHVKFKMDTKMEVCFAGLCPFMRKELVSPSIHVV